MEVPLVGKPEAFHHALNVRHDGGVMQAKIRDGEILAVKKGA
jgi:hypothetical protein